MSKGYVGGENQDSKVAKKQIANFAEAAKGMGFALGVIATGEKAVNLGKEMIENATVTAITADDAWGAREGDQVVKLDGATVSGSLAFGASAVILAYTGRREMKKAFVYGGKGLYKASKTTLSFAKKAVDELQHLTQEYVAEDRAHPNKPTFFNKVNAFFGKSR